MNTAYRLRSYQSRKRISDLTALYDTYPIDADATLDAKNYLEPVARYKLTRKEARCQYLRDGRQCGQQHMLGVVLRTTENKHVLVGHCCASDKLGVEHENVGNELQLFTRAVELAERQDRLEAVIRDKDTKLSTISRFLSDLASVQNAVNTLRENLPEKVVIRLEDMAKTQSSQVIWEYQIIKEGKVEGQMHKETRWHPITVSQLKGLSVWDQALLIQTRKELAALRTNLKDISLSSEPGEKEISNTENLLLNLSHLGSYERTIERYQKRLRDFSGRQNLFLLPHIISDHAQRSNCLDTVRRILSEGALVSAKKEVAAFDANLRHEYRASNVRLKR